MVYQEDEQSGGKKKRGVRVVRKPARAAMAKPKKAPARKRVFHNKLMKHFGGFFAELEGFAQKMDGQTPSTKQKQPFTNGLATPPMGPPATPMHRTQPPMPPPTPMQSSMSEGQDGGRIRRFKKASPKKSTIKKARVVRKVRKYGGMGEEEFSDSGFDQVMNGVGSIADQTIGKIATATSQGVGATGLMGGVRRGVRRASSPSYRASYRATAPVVRRRRAASPRR
jgi:hypothetical protein